LFCQIADGEIAAEIVYEDEDVIAFRDIHPQAPIHILIIPRQHVSNLNGFKEGDEALLGKLLLRAKYIANDLGVAEDGYRININTNDHGGQTVYHLHVHLLAGRQFHWPPG
ncbi:MAG: histidine triad nucleotide-binding protein, partial [Gammaproteobacteria bacterium]|nr:histidine triad nucleotide-binding protein [Gammaproteobacteria bacterium]